MLSKPLRRSLNPCVTARVTKRDITEQGGAANRPNDGLRLTFPLGET